MKILFKKTLKRLLKPLSIAALALGLTLPATAQPITPRWGYLSPATNLTVSTGYAPTPTNVAANNGKVGATNLQLDVFRDRGLTLWLSVNQTNSVSTSSNTVVIVDCTPNGTLWTTNWFTWTVPFQATNFVTRTNLSDAVIGDVKSIRLTNITPGVTNVVLYGPLMWSFTP